MKTQAKYIYMGKGKKLPRLVKGLLKPDQLMLIPPKLMDNLGRGQGSAETYKQGEIQAT